jgi:hypothetical protein
LYIGSRDGTSTELEFGDDATVGSLCEVLAEQLAFREEAVSGLTLQLRPREGFILQFFYIQNFFSFTTLEFHPASKAAHPWFLSRTRALPT